MAVTIQQNPGSYNLANGINAVTLSGISSSALKYVMQIKDMTGNDVLADIRQAPNASGRALFDIQQILQSYVSPSPARTAFANGWVDGESETFNYRIYYGEEDASGTITIDGFLTSRLVMSGRKEWDDITWSGQSNYRYTLTQNGGCTTVQTQGQLLTDYPTLVPASSLSGVVPSYITSYTNAQAYEVDVYADTEMSISFLQDPIDVGTVTARNITGARLTAYDSSGTVLNATMIYNWTGLGGGPDTSPGNNGGVVYPYWAMTLPCGPGDSEVASELPVGTAYYYITLHSYQLTACSNPRQYPNVTETPSLIAYRFNIIDGDCNDFDRIQVTWQNSLGFQDYYTFTKRHDESYKADRNLYLKNTFDWNASSVSITEGARGYTTFGQKLQQSFVAYTDWLSDAESQWLKNLFLSSTIRVKLPGSNVWEAAVIESNQYQVRTIRKDRTFQYELRFRLANNLNSQRG